MHRSCGFFLSFRDEIIKTYDELFVTTNDERPVIKTREQSFGEKWGWYQSVYAIARGDVLKFEQVTKSGLHSCLNWLSFEKEKVELEEKRIKERHR